MTADSITQFAVHAGLVVLGIAFLLTVWRVVRGPTLPDRVIALDMLVGIVMGFIALIAIRTGFTLYIDIAISLGLVGFLATVAFARFILSRKRRGGEDGAPPEPPPPEPSRGEPAARPVRRGKAVVAARKEAPKPVLSKSEATKASAAKVKIAKAKAAKKAAPADAAGAPAVESPKAKAKAPRKPVVGKETR